MRVLFLHANTPDYLSAGLFHGLRSLLGKDCVDLPRFDCMYSPLSGGIKEKIRGNAFTLYGLLKDITEVDDQRFFIWQKNINDFDFYIIADIWNQWDTYIKLIELVPFNKIIIVDPSDSTRVYPFNNLSSNYLVLIFKLLLFKKDKVKYFKREIQGESNIMTGLNFLPNFISKMLVPSKIHPIHFSIPEEKITQVNIEFKTKQFTTIIVDDEMNKLVDSSFLIPLGKEVYAFSDEKEYYKDIQLSKFGITTKRSGWDCLRHYEYTANGAVLCFKNYSDKFIQCAPYGLNETNCIFYNTSSELIEKLATISDLEYTTLLKNSYKWVKNNTTLELAKKFVNQIQHEATIS